MKTRRLWGNRALSLMYEFTRDLAGAGELDAVLQTIVAHVGRTFNCALAILLPGPEKLLAVAAASPGFELSSGERVAAEETFRRSESLDRGAATLLHDSANRVYFPAASGIRCLPLQTPRGTLGVLCMAAAEACAEMNGEQLRLLEVFTNQAALAIERARAGRGGTTGGAAAGYREAANGPSPLDLA